jgi:hypothetical protein
MKIKISQLHILNVILLRGKGKKKNHSLLAVWLMSKLWTGTLLLAALCYFPTKTYQITKNSWGKIPHSIKRQDTKNTIEI